jgi:hypothetical protein
MAIKYKNQLFHFLKTSIMKLKNHLDNQWEFGAVYDTHTTLA